MVYHPNYIFTSHGWMWLCEWFQSFYNKSIVKYIQIDGKLSLIEIAAEVVSNFKFIWVSFHLFISFNFSLSLSLIFPFSLSFIISFSFNLNVSIGHSVSSSYLGDTCRTTPITVSLWRWIRSGFRSDQWSASQFLIAVLWWSWALLIFLLEYSLPSSLFRAFYSSSQPFCKCVYYLIVAIHPRLDINVLSFP